MMTLSPTLRKLNLTAHVTTSVGWMGAVAGFLVLSIAGLTSADADTVRGAYLMMNLLGQFLIVPLSLAALTTGLVQALGTHWGLFKYYWVLSKFVLTLGATLLLVLHQFTAVAVAAKRISTSAAGSLPKIGGLGTQLVVDASLALLVLIALTAISVYKPWGKIPGRQTIQAQGSASGSLAISGAQSQATGLSTGLKLALVLLAMLVAAFVLSHMAGGGMHRHGLWMTQQLASIL